MAPPIRQDLDELKEILNEEIAFYTQVEEKMGLKKAYVIQGNVEELVRIDQEMIALTQKTTELEKKRIAVMIRMGREKQTLKEFIDCLDVQDIRPFREARQRLSRVVESVKDLNQQNQNLLKLSLRWIESSVETIARLLAPEGAAYTARGDIRNPTKQRIEPSTLGQSTIEHSA